MSEKKKEASGSRKSIGGILMSKMARGGARRLRSKAEKVNRLNVFPVPDGDTGDNMRMTIESGIAAIENMDSDDLAEVMKALSHGMLLGARGNSGVILSQFFAGTAKGLEGTQNADPATFGRALELGVEQAYSSVLVPTEGTILTVAREAVEYAVANLSEASTIRTLFADLVKEMHRSLDRTPEILAVLKEAGVVDSGGAGLYYIIEGFNRVLNGEEISDTAADPAPERAPAPSPAPAALSLDEDEPMRYGYCTELLLQLQRRKTDAEPFDLEALRRFLSEVGDSVVAFQTDRIVKLHVHTFTPEAVLAYGRRFGEFLTVKIENMSLQHSSLESGAASEAEAAPAQPTEPAAPAAEEPIKPYAIVAVANGPGIEALYRELGVDAVVLGGQTHNPSTGDFLEAFGQVRAKDIFVFPNNSNIFMAASQAAELYAQATVHVLPSKDVGTGYVAISAADLNAPDADAVLASMKEAMARVTAGSISPAIRDADIGGVHIQNGDTMGILGREIVLSCPDRMEAVTSLASRLLSLPDKFLLTVFCGADSTETEQAALSSYLSSHYPSAEVYFIPGGQEIYPYLFTVE